MPIFAETGRWGSRAAIIAVSALVWGAAGTRVEAQVQPALPANCTGTQTGNALVANFAGGAVSSAIAGIIGSVNTAFLTQQGSAFVSAPGNPAPDQPGGGIWSRALA